MENVLSHPLGWAIYLLEALYAAADIVIGFFWNNACPECGTSRYSEIINWRLQSTRFKYHDLYKESEGGTCFCQRCNINYI